METQILHDMSDELKSFIIQYVNSYISWDILTYFFDTPGIIRADAEEIASSIGRDVEKIQPILETMYTKGILVGMEEHNKRLYSPNTKGSFYSIISKFLQFTATRQGRLQTIYMITAEKFKREE